MRQVEKLLVLVLVVIGIVMAACAQNEVRVQPGQKVVLKPGPKAVKTNSGLIYEDLVVGSDRPILPGRQVLVHYDGWLEDGTKFDSSVDRNEPFLFVYGRGQVIPGWEEGLATMKVDGRRRLFIPPDLAYGAQGSGRSVPPNATLIFEVEILDTAP
ncbi:MAG TPA: FKBP-type peptidyl-prolyl cis-trans isomerase [Geobacteraceae bacterium]